MSSAVHGATIKTTQKIKRSDQRYLNYRVFNFHHDELLKSLRTWMEGEYPQPLLLEGMDGVGRGFALQAAAYHPEASLFHVIEIDAEQLDQSPAMLLELEKVSGLTEKQQTLWHEIKGHLSEAQLQNDSGSAGFAIVVKLGLALSATELVWDYFRQQKNSEIEYCLEDYLKKIINTITQEKQIIFYLKNAAAASRITKLLFRVCKEHNSAARSDNKQHFCLMALACQQHTQLIKHFKSYLLDTNYELLRFAPLSLSDLQIVLPQRGIHLPNEVLSLFLVHSQHRSERFILPREVFTLLKQLKSENLLVEVGDEHQLVSGTTQDTLRKHLGSPLTTLYENALADIEGDGLRQQVRDYMALAALCGTHTIPQIPLLYGLGLDYYRNDDDQTQGDLILDTVDDYFAQPDFGLLLESYGILSDVEDKALYGYRLVHPMMQGYLLDHWDDNDRVKYAHTLLDHFATLLPTNNHARHGLMLHLANQVGGEVEDDWVDQLYYHLTEAHIPEYKAELDALMKVNKTQASAILQQILKYPSIVEHEAYLSATLEVGLTYLGLNQYPKIGTRLHNLADHYQKKVAYSTALFLYKEAIEIQKKALGDEHFSAAASLNNLAEVYRAMGEYEQALPLYERSLVISEKTLGNEHPDVATNLNNLALLYHSMGEYEQALPLYERSLAICEKTLGDEHPHVAASLNNLADLHKLMGEYERALPLYERSLAMREKL